MNPVKDHTNNHSSDELEKKAVVKMASDVLLSLSKALKALKLYPDNSPVRHKFISDLTGKFTKFLEEYGDLTLAVRQYDLLYQGEVVYNNPVKEDSIAFKFFGDGIQEVAFSDNIDEQELLDFINVIQGNGDHADGDDDIVTLMWQKEFKNIRYVVIEDSGDAADGRPEGKSSDAESVTIKSADALRNAHKSESVHDQTLAADGSSAPGIEREIEEIYGKPFDEIFVLSPDEINSIKQEMEREAKSDLILEMLDILFHILEIEEDAVSYAEIMSYVEKSVKMMTLCGDYKHALGSLNRITAISETEKDNRPAHAETARATLYSLGDEAFLQQLTESLNASKTENVDELYNILTMLDNKAISPMTTMLSTLENIKARRVVCDALAVIAKDNLESVLKKLQDGNWYTVRNIVYVLGRIGDAKVLNHLKRIKDHKEPRVRKEIVHTLSEIKSDEAKNMLASYLNDSDNTVRIAALKRICSMEHRRALPGILQIISSEEFDGKESYEKKELFEAIATLGTQDQLPFLKELLMKKSWLFGKSKADEMRLLSVQALTKMKVPGAMEIIREGASSSDKVIRKICEDTLRSTVKGEV
ncbi:MAG: HEAT repeat domain-containing protein [Nitrospirae bacterium]|nr:HEAT repeat domain-containing protein [Nitrospirota bacterium]